MDNLENYLNTMVRFRSQCGSLPEGFNYTCNEDYVLTMGSRQRLSESLTDGEMEVVRAAYSIGRFAPLRAKECFYNCQRLVLNDPSDELQYWEGYAMGDAILPVHHAWLTIGGKVVDYTWRHGKDRDEDLETLLSNTTGEPVLGEIPEGWAYMGCSFPKHQILSNLLSQLDNGGEDAYVRSFLNNWEDGFPHLRRERPTA